MFGIAGRASARSPTPDPRSSIQPLPAPLLGAPTDRSRAVLLGRLLAAITPGVLCTATAGRSVFTGVITFIGSRFIAHRGRFDAQVVAHIADAARGFGDVFGQTFGI